MSGFFCGEPVTMTDSGEEIGTIAKGNDGRVSFVPKPAVHIIPLPSSRDGRQNAPSARRIAIRPDATSFPLGAKSL